MFAEIVCLYLFIGMILLMPIYKSLDPHIDEEDTRIAFSYIIALAWPVAGLVIFGFILYYCWKS